MEDTKLTTRQAYDHLFTELKNDPEFYNAWKSNLAMRFQDEFHKNYLTQGIQQISNKAAKSFLDMLISKIEK